MSIFTGAGVALVTPFKEDLSFLIQSDRETSDCIWNCIYMDHCRFHGIKYVHVTICLDPL